MMVISKITRKETNPLPKVKAPKRETPKPTETKENHFQTHTLEKENLLQFFHCHRHFL